MRRCFGGLLLQLVLILARSHAQYIHDISGQEKTNFPSGQENGQLPSFPALPVTPVRLAMAHMRFQNKGGYVFVPDRPIVVIGSLPSSPQTLDIQGDPDIISSQSGSAGEQG